MTKIYKYRILFKNETKVTTKGYVDKSTLPSRVQLRGSMAPMIKLPWVRIIYNGNPEKYIEINMDDVQLFECMG